MYDMLIVDDEYYICEAIKAKILRLDIKEIGEIKICYSSEEALEICKTFKPQIVVTDIKMDDMNGIEMMSILNRMLFPVRFLVLSGYDDYMYVREAFREGAVDYLLKPVVTDQLHKNILSICDSLSHTRVSRYGTGNNIYSMAASLNSLLFSKHNTDRIKKDHESNISMILDHPFIYLCVLGFRESGVIKDESLILRHIYDFLQRIEQPQAICSITTGEKIAIVLNGDENTTVEKIILRLGELIQYLKVELKTDVSAAVGGSGTLSELGVLYEQAQRALSNRLVDGYNRIVMYGKKEQSTAKISFPLKINHLLETLINSPDTFSIHSFAFELGQAVHVLSLEQLRKLYALIVNYIRMHTEDNHMPAYDVDFTDFDDLRTLEEYQLSLVNHLAMYLELLNHDSQKSKHMMERIKKYIDANYCKGITLYQIADMFSISYTYLSKSFKAYFDLSFTEYVGVLRMQKAMELLEDSSRSIQKISDQVGYDSTFHFSRAFKNYFGFSPTAYRKTMQE